NSIVDRSTPAIAPLTPEDAYKTFLRYLNSSTVKQRFFELYYLPAQDENDTELQKQRAWERLSEELTVGRTRGGNEFEYRVTIEGADPEVIAAWANSYVSLT